MLVGLIFLQIQFQKTIFSTSFSTEIKVEQRVIIKVKQTVKCIGFFLTFFSELGDHIYTEETKRREELYAKENKGCFIFYGIAGNNKKFKLAFVNLKNVISLNFRFMHGLKVLHASFMHRIGLNNNPNCVCGEIQSPQHVLVCQTIGIQGDIKTNVFFFFLIVLMQQTQSNLDGKYMYILFSFISNFETLNLV